MPEKDIEKDVGKKVKPTELEKKEKATSEKIATKMFVKGKEMDVEIEVETKPNANGGYDTKVKIPVCPIGAKTGL